MPRHALAHLSDPRLLQDLDTLDARDHETTSDLLAYLGEVDARRLYLPAGYPSMFAYCVGQRGYSEDVAYKRIRVARAARRFPALFAAVAEGRLSLSAVMLLSPYLTVASADELLAAAAHKTNAGIEQLLAERFPRPDVPTLVRALPSTTYPGQLAVRPVEGPAGQAPSGLAGQAPSELTGQAPSGQAGLSSSGLTGQAPSELTGQAPSGLAAQSPSGLAGLSPSGQAGLSSSGLAGQTPSGLAGQAPSGLAGVGVPASGRWPAGIDPQVTGRAGEVPSGQPAGGPVGAVISETPEPAPAGQLAVRPVGSSDPTPVAPPEPIRLESPLPRPRVTPLAPQRFALQVTIGQGTHDRLRRAQALLGHQVPSGDVAKVLDLALEALIAKLEARKFAATRRSKKAPRRAVSEGRHIPAEVRRAVRRRDGDRCTFVSESGHRCEARTRLEFDHIEPFARGGDATVSGIRLRCRAHNQFEAERTYGPEFMRRKRQAAAQAKARATVRGEAGPSPGA